MKARWKTRFGTCVLMLLGGCATQGPQFERLSSGAPAQKVGWVVFSFTTTCFTNMAPMLESVMWLHGVDNKVKGLAHGTGAFNLQTGAKPPDAPMPHNTGPRITLDDPSGVIVLLELPEGRYVFDHYQMNVNGYPFSAAYTSAPAFQYTFEVVAGKVNYIGDLNLDYIPSGVNFQANDQRRRDGRLFDAQFPNYGQKG